METIKLGLLDLFAYTIPGGLALLIVYFWVAGDPALAWSDLKGALVCAKFSAGVVWFVAAYLTGFTTGIVAECLLRWIEKGVRKQWPKCKLVCRDCGSAGEISKKYCVARHHSPNNAVVIDQLHVAKRMTSNLSLITLLGGVLLAWKLCSVWGLLGIPLSLLYFCAACRFHRIEVVDVESLNDLYVNGELRGKS